MVSLLSRRFFVSGESWHVVSCLSSYLSILVSVTVWFRGLRWHLASHQKEKKGFRLEFYGLGCEGFVRDSRFDSVRSDFDLDRFRILASSIMMVL